MTFFVTSDTHFGHKNIAEYCPGRQSWCGDTLQTHDDALVEQWNAIVQPSDVVIHCGDFAFGSGLAVKTYRERLNGVIWMALGNHDRTLASMKTCFRTDDRVGHGLLIRVGNKIVVVRHMPLVGPPGKPSAFAFAYEESQYADELWHGHVHDRPYQPETPKHVAWGIDTRPNERIVPLLGAVHLLAVLST